MNKSEMTLAALAAFLRGDNLNGTIASSPNGIVEQEAQGQKNLIESKCLPISGDWDKLMSWGIVKGEPVDDQFVLAELPQGWHLEATGSVYWTNLLDEHGTVRASIFYKAAFYDRKAFFRVKE
jgi:hypothetical protein